MSFSDWASNMWSDVTSLFGGSKEPEYQPVSVPHVEMPATKLHMDGLQDYAYDPLLTAQQVGRMEENPNKLRDIARRGFDDAHGGDKHVYEDYSDAEWNKYRAERDAYMDKFVEDDLSRREKEYAASPEGKAAKKAEDDRRRQAEADEMERIRAQLRPVR